MKYSQLSVLLKRLSASVHSSAVACDLNELFKWKHYINATIVARLALSLFPDVFEDLETGVA